jgi:hypothetical protein
LVYTFYKYIKMDEILNKLTAIEQRLTYIEKEIALIKQGTITMNNHISFVESIYNSVKIPFHFMLDKFTLPIMITY